MAEVIANQNETLDGICYRHYGDNSMVEAVLKANPHIARVSKFLPEGTVLVMPERKPITRKTRLWG